MFLFVFKNCVYRVYSEHEIGPDVISRVKVKGFIMHFKQLLAMLACTSAMSVATR